MKKIVSLLFLATNLFATTPIAQVANLTAGDHTATICLPACAKATLDEQQILIQEINSISRSPDDIEREAALKLQIAINNATQARTEKQIESLIKFHKLTKEEQLHEKVRELPFPNEARKKLYEAICSGDNKSIDTAFNGIDKKLKESFIKFCGLNKRERLREKAKEISFPDEIKDNLCDAICSEDEKQLAEARLEAIAHHRIDEVRVIDVDSFVKYLQLPSKREEKLLSLQNNDDGYIELLQSLKSKVENGLMPRLKKYVSEGWADSPVFRQQMIAYTALTEATNPSPLATLGNCLGKETHYSIREDKDDWHMFDSEVYIPPKEIANSKTVVVDTLYGNPKPSLWPSFRSLGHEFGHTTDLVLNACNKYSDVNDTKFIMPALLGMRETEYWDTNTTTSLLKSKWAEWSEIEPKFLEFFNEVTENTEEFKNIEDALFYIQKNKEWFFLKALVTSSSEVWQIDGLSSLHVNSHHILLVNKIGSDLAEDVYLNQPIRSSHADQFREKCISSLGYATFSRNKDIYDPLLQLSCGKTWDEYEKSVYIPWYWKVFNPVATAVESCLDTLQSWENTIKNKLHSIKECLSRKIWEKPTQTQLPKLKYRKRASSEISAIL